MCPFVLAIKGTRKHDLVEFKGEMGSAIEGCKGGDSNDLVVPKLENICYDSFHGKSS